MDIRKPKMVILVGPPGSGKSTCAAKYAEQGYVRISQDDQGSNHVQLLFAALQAGSNIIVDRMNFSVVQRERYLAPGRNSGYHTAIQVLHTSYQECYDRMERRWNTEKYPPGFGHIGHPTINNKESARSALHTFFTKYEKPLVGEADTIELQYPETKGSCIIVDLDGTLCNTDHRQHHMHSTDGGKKNWPAFFREMGKDPPHDWCRTLIASVCLAEAAEVVLCSGRPNDYRADTEDWLYRYGVEYSHLLMRSEKDSRRDDVIKEIILDFEILTRYKEIIFAVDDRQQVVDLWRRRGITALQCAKGDF